MNIASIFIPHRSLRIKCSHSQLYRSPVLQPGCAQRLQVFHGTHTLPHTNILGPCVSSTGLHNVTWFTLVLPRWGLLCWVCRVFLFCWETPVLRVLSVDLALPQVHGSTAPQLLSNTSAGTEQMIHIMVQSSKHIELLPSAEALCVLCTWSGPIGILLITMGFMPIWPCICAGTWPICPAPAPLTGPGPPMELFIITGPNWPWLPCWGNCCWGYEL